MQPESRPGPVARALAWPLRLVALAALSHPIAFVVATVTTIWLNVTDPPEPSGLLLPREPAHSNFWMDWPVMWILLFGAAVWFGHAVDEPPSRRRR